MIKDENSVGIVETKYYTIDEKIKFDSGVEFGPITVAYETYGTLNEDGTVIGPNSTPLSNLIFSSIV